MATAAAKFHSYGDLPWNLEAWDGLQAGALSPVTNGFVIAGRISSGPLHLSGFVVPAPVMYPWPVFQWS